MRQSVLRQEVSNIKASEKHSNPKSLIPFGYKIYSQNDEDGIIQEIFSRIGTTNKTFVEFGVEDGIQSNTYALFFSDWKGLWIEASKKHINKIRKNLAPVIESGQLSVAESFITKDNINTTISDHIKDSEIDLLSVDIDGNDYHIYDAINCINPRVVVMEYNAKFAPPIQYCMDYDENHIFEYNDSFGVSLKYLETHLDKKGYYLVGCNIAGVNAFFVRKDLVGDLFMEPFTAEQHYEPSRGYLTAIDSGWGSSYSALLKSGKCRT